MSLGVIFSQFLSTSFVLTNLYIRSSVIICVISYLEHSSMSLGVEVVSAYCEFNLPVLRLLC